MSLSCYADYKDSGVASLGLVPSHWQVKRLRFIAELNPSKSEVASLDRQTEVSFLPMDAIGDDGAIRLDETRPLAQVENGYTYFRDGDVVIAKITPCFENGKGAVVSGLLDGIGFGTTELIVVRPKPQVARSEYLGWLFTSPTFRKDAEGAMYGAGGQKRVPDSFVRDYLDAVPPLEEQSSIATFLDRETGKIDALIAEQEKLLTLLAEKRQATISHAVTRGLTNLPGADLNAAFGGGPKGEGKDSPSHPNAPMKDSGVPWLGEVPAHWEITRLKYVTDAIVDCPHETPIYDPDGDYLVIRTADLDRGVLDSSEMYRLSHEQYQDRTRRSSLQADDIVYGREGERWGHAALVPESDRFCLGQRMMQFRPSPRMRPAFLMWQLNSVGTYRQGELDTVGSTSPHVNVSTIRNFRLALPPLDEQRAIAARLDCEAMRFDELQAEAARAISLLREHRSALIAAAVTGKIDVRQK